MEEIDHKVRAHYQVSEDADATEETADSDKSAGKDVEIERCRLQIVKSVSKTKFKVYLDGQFAFILYKGELFRYRYTGRWRAE